MLRKAIQIFLTLFPLLSQAQTDCIRSQALLAGELLRYDYPTDYYIDGDTFDFPLFKIWKGQTGDRVWTVSTRFPEEKVVVQADRTLAAPDTLRFERFIKANGKSKQYQLTRFFGDIYQVWKITQTSYAWPGQHTTILIPVEVRTFERTFVGWPDDYMSESAYKTDRKKIAEKIEKYRCKDFDAGKRKAGVQ